MPELKNEYSFDFLQLLNLSQGKTATILPKNRPLMVNK